MYFTIYPPHWELTLLQFLEKTETIFNKAIKIFDDIFISIILFC